MDNTTSDVFIALIGVLSMVVARLLDWYFPLGRTKSRRQIRDEVKRSIDENGNSQ